jgi:diguanylate cyclase (GGDEF)-like protein
MSDYVNHDEIEDLHRRIAFAEACSDPLNFDQMLSRVCGLLNEWAQADVVTLILPPEDDNLEPMLHLFGQQPVLPLSERCVRDDCSALLSELEYAHLPGESLRLRRGADIRPITGIIRDDFMYRFWWHDMKMHGETVAIIGLYGFVDWVLSARLRRLLTSLMSTLSTAINNAGSVENFRIASDRDEVTGGLNQRGVFEYLDRECARSTDKQTELSCILFQLEDYDSISGTLKGEKILQSLYEQITTSLRPYHMVGRIADAEFVALMPEASSNEVEIIAGKLETVARQITLDEKPLVVRTGWSTMTNCTADELLHRADESLHQARKAGAAAGYHAS